MVGAMAQVRPKGASIQSIDLPLSTGHTVGSGEDRMEHKIVLTNPVPQTSHDSPLLEGHTPGSDEGIMTLNELTDLYTTLFQKVLDLENVKTAQEKRHSLGRRKVSKHGRKNLKSQKKFQDIDDLVDKGMNFDIDNDADIEMIVKDKDKGKCILQESEPVKKTKKKNQDQIERDAEVALKIQADLNKEAKTDGERQEEASKAALAEMYDEVQAQIDADHELTARLTYEEQEKYTIKERFTHAQLKIRSFKEIQKLYIKEHKWVDAFVPIGSKEDEKRIGSRKKRAEGSSLKHKSPKKQKMLKVLDRKDVLDLYKNVMERFPDSDLEGFEILVRAFMVFDKDLINLVIPDVKRGRLLRIIFELIRQNIMKQDGNKKEQSYHCGILQDVGDNEDLDKKKIKMNINEKIKMSI
uniref:Uncharacterized protein n=1 Tax=Tanacetum cinerariifolium TaxID=118510 RepID=A0A6L2LVJ3_TANCI|nr:hypothetical protein [Tanacetum cinerariifolium]